MFTRSTILDFTGKKLALSFIAHQLVDGQRPPYVHLVSTRRHSRDRFSQAFPVFRALPLPCIILNENRRTKNGGGLGTRLCLQYVNKPSHLMSSHVMLTLFHASIEGLRTIVDYLTIKYKKLLKLHKNEVKNIRTL